MLQFGRMITRVLPRNGRFVIERFDLGCWFPYVPGMTHDSAKDAVNHLCSVHGPQFSLETCPVCKRKSAVIPKGNACCRACTYEAADSRTRLRMVFGPDG